MPTASATPSERAQQRAERRRATAAPGEDEPGDLAAGRPGRAEQADLADPLGDRHREGVEDQERPDEQRDRRDQGGRRPEVGGRGAQRRREVARATERTYGSSSSRRVERPPRPSSASAPSVEPDVDAARRPSAPKTALAPRRSARRRPGRSAPTSGPSPARMPTTRTRSSAGRRRRSSSSRRRRRRPSSRARRSRDSADGSSGRDSAAPATSWQVVDLRIERRVDAEDGDRRRRRRRSLPTSGAR